MSRVTGWYKRWTKLVLAMTGLVIAILVNVDTVQVARQLYVNEPVRAAVLSQVNDANLCRDETDPVNRAACAQDEVAKLEASGLPLWWSGDTNPSDAGDWAAKILGFSPHSRCRSERRSGSTPSRSSAPCARQDRSRAAARRAPPQGDAVLSGHGAGRLIGERAFAVAWSAAVPADSHGVDMQVSTCL